MAKKRIFGLISAAVLVETLITYLKQLFANGILCWEMLASIAIGILISYIYKIDIIRYLGLNTRYLWINYIITGILLSRGSTYIFNLLSRIK